MGRVLSEDALAAAVTADREGGRTIAFANGCFDVMHVGHVRYLAGAAAQADRLIVAINDDESVKGLKGPGRPILSGADRAEMVAALEDVDYVVLFPDPDVHRLLQAAQARRALQGHRLHAGHGARARDRHRLRRPRRHRRRSQGSFHARSARSHQVERGGGFARLSTRASKVLIVRLGSLGDIIHAIPAAAAIRRAFPHAESTGWPTRVIASSSISCRSSVAGF